MGRRPLLAILLSGAQGLEKTLKILRINMNESTPRAVDVGDEQECNGRDQRENQKQDASPFGVSGSVADQQIAADCDQSHQRPRGMGNSVPPGGLCVSLRVQHIVHAGNRQGNNRIRLRRRRHYNRRPHLVLQLRGSGIDLVKLVFVARQVEGDSLIEVASEQLPHFCRVGGRQQARPDEVRCRWRWPPPPRSSCADRTG